MQLKQVMTRNVETIEPDATLERAAGKMASLDVGMLPVCEGSKLVGTITDRDITVRATARGLDPRKTQVQNAMTKVVVCDFEDQDVRDGARMMMDNRIRRLLILNGHKKLTGIISLSDLATSTDDKNLVAEVLEQVSEPTRVPARA
jgi:CBS domain-containing protein